jgi:hypothetical protein
VLVAATAGVPVLLDLPKIAKRTRCATRYSAIKVCYIQGGKDYDLEYSRETEAWSNVDEFDAASANLLVLFLAAMLTSRSVLQGRFLGDMRPEMFCKKCGAPNDDSATMCSRCGTALGSVVAPSGEPVPNYLVYAILTTVFCCLPFGIVSIVYAAQVNSKLAGGDYQGAVDSSSKAKMWALVSMACGLVAVVFYIVIAILSVAAGPGMNR